MKLSKAVPVLTWVLLALGFFRPDVSAGVSPNLLEKPPQAVWQETTEDLNYRKNTYTVRAQHIFKASRSQLYQAITRFEDYAQWMPYFRNTRLDMGLFKFAFELKDIVHDMILSVDKRENMNGHYSWLRLSTDREFDYPTVRALNQSFSIYNLVDTQTGAVAQEYALLEVVNHTQVGDLGKLISEKAMKQNLLEITEEMFQNLQGYLDDMKK